ncbi:unnamed protein product [Musa acuminata subsp. malaccensis]|uniref:RING-type E3 ubiquitin transferase n=1 Tax=Musa acuminata subsp. malaccensis TaxID=214687 RepID=A0A804L9T5_MUSAM|nr:unnamed protein product [Musa acuminata subsp. malaccensis]
MCLRGIPAKARSEGAVVDVEVGGGRAQIHRGRWKNLMTMSRTKTMIGLGNRSKCCVAFLYHQSGLSFLYWLLLFFSFSLFNHSMSELASNLLSAVLICLKLMQGSLMEANLRGVENVSLRIHKQTFSKTLHRHYKLQTNFTSSEQLHNKGSKWFTTDRKSLTSVHMTQSLFTSLKRLSNPTKMRLLSLRPSLYMLAGMEIICNVPYCLGYDAFISFLKQEGASEQDIHQLPKYKFHKVGDSEKLEMSGPSGGIMTECGSDSLVQHVLLAEDAISSIECCICLSPYDDGVELRELPCGHHFHRTCIDKWLRINATYGELGKTRWVGHEAEWIGSTYTVTTNSGVAYYLYLHWIHIRSKSAQSRCDRNDVLTTPGETMANSTSGFHIFQFVNGEHFSFC